MNQTMLRGSLEEVVVPHRDAAFNYARRLRRSDSDGVSARVPLLLVAARLGCPGRC
jgi:hypothetical protein